LSLREIAATMTVDTFAVEAQTDVVDTPDAVIDSPDETAAAVTSAADAAPAADAVEPAAPVAEEKPKRAPAKKAAPKKTKTLELTLTVTGTADGEWKAELKQGNSYIAKNLLVAAAAVSRAAKELHEDLSGPIDEVIDAAREQQAAKVAALEAELEAARKALAELDD
jgi:pyruvate/2-oxoglutarate dehydrogenase complex dihydrolipoamide acyltransferase (E2) component